MKKALTLSITAMLLAGCSTLPFSDSKTNANEQAVKVQEEQALIENEQEEIIEEEPVTKVRIGMFGDVLLHNIIAHYEDYSVALAPISGNLRQYYDFLMANQESLAVGNKFAITGYPRFASPEYVMQDLKEEGVDLLNLANNHVLDKGEQGLRTEIENIEKLDLPYVGAYKSQKDADTMRIFDVEGIKIGVLSYTYGTNGLQVPEGKDYLVNYIMEEKIKDDIQAMRSEADVITVNMHWGDEYVTEENETQNRLAKMINEAGADIIFGGHPHVVQPYEEIVRADGFKTSVFYSIGNFYATILSVPSSMIGGIASFRIVKQGNEITIDRPIFKATLVSNKEGIYKVYPLAQHENSAPHNLQWVQNVLGEQVTVR